MPIPPLSARTKEEVEASFAHIAAALSDLSEANLGRRVVTEKALKLEWREWDARLSVDPAATVTLSNYEVDFAEYVLQDDTMTFQYGATFDVGGTGDTSDVLVSLPYDVESNENLISKKIPNFYATTRINGGNLEPGCAFVERSAASWNLVKVRPPGGVRWTTGDSGIITIFGSCKVEI